jgi:hypothetical protein
MDAAELAARRFYVAPGQGTHGEDYGVIVAL